MKSKTNHSAVVADNLSPAIVRAELAVGQALRQWLVDEYRSGELEFSDVALALHFVIASACSSDALARCSPLSAEQMQEHYCALVNVCFREQFEANIRRVRNGS